MNEIDFRIQKINKERDRQKLYNWYRNGHEHKMPSIMRAALKRAIELKAAGFDPDSDFEEAVFHALAGYEIALSIKNNRRVAANRTRNLLKRRTPQEALEFLVSVSNESYGFQTLADMQLAEFTFEGVVVRFPNLFTPEQVEKAQRRLDDIFENRGADFVYPEIRKNLF
jgi:hypothetical protein